MIDHSTTFVDVWFGLIQTIIIGVNRLIRDRLTLSEFKKNRKFMF